MRNKRKFVFIAAIAVAFFCIFGSLSEAQSSRKMTVAEVKVEGNNAISSPTIISKIRTQPGTTFAQEVINDDIKRLYALGYFTDVSFDAEETDKGIVVTVIVEEKPVIQEIIFEGNQKMSAGKLKKVMKTKEGDMLNYSRLSEDVTELKSFYERNGFSEASVKYELEKDEYNQVTVKIVVREKARIRIKKVTVEGNESVKSKVILDLMQTRPAWLLRRGYFDDETFENDLAKIKMYYQNIGFLDTAIDPTFDYETEKGLMYINLKINEGKQYAVGEISIRGNLIFPEEEVAKEVTLKTGQPFSYGQLREDMENIRKLYYHRGYMNADIVADRVLQPQAEILNVVFTVDAREIVSLGRVSITGNTKTKDIIIRRELRVYPGERFDGDKLRRSKERLYNLGFFEDIYFETIPTDEPNVSDLNISVKESKTGEFSFGGGYSSVDQFIGFVQVRQRNFDLLNWPYFTGDGQDLVIRADLGMVRYDFDISWTEPWIFDYPLSFGVDGYHRTHLRRTHVGYGYKEMRTGGDVRFGKEFMEYFKGDLMYRLENVDISDVSSEASQDEQDEAGRNWLSTAILGVHFDNRDNIYAPKKGFYSGISINNTGGFLLGDKTFVKGFWSNSFYWTPPWPILNKVVLELKGRAGLGTAYWKSDKIPIYERFYAGGANTIRGYRERKVGPRDPASNDPIGGESLLIGNMEVVFPLYENLVKGAIFYDVGNVWAKAKDFAWDGGYKQGVGVGVRVKTPIGPIKLDWGYPLNSNHDDKREGQFYFSVSHGW
ncbi:outer membrane protein assembly factor BamA [Candidatus Omnitrophota bacterium]